MAKYLLKRDGRFYAVLEIPAKVRSQFNGKVRFVKSLKTDRPSLARQRVGPMVANWKSQIAVALGEDDNDFIWPEDDGRMTSALMILHRLREAKGDDKREMWRDLEYICRDGGTAIERKVAGIMESIDVTVQDIRAIDGDDDAERFYDTATGGRERYDAHLDDWLALSTATDKTKRMLRYDVLRLAEAFPIAQDISRARVKGWVTALQVEQGLAPKTVTRILGALKGYWRHLQSIEAVSLDLEPFDRLDIPRNGNGHGKKKRIPFEPSEVVALHAAAVAKGDDKLADLITILKWTGARVSEVCALRCEDVAGDHFTIRAAKTDAGVRTVPLHKNLRQTMTRLIEESTDGFVLSGLAANADGDRSNPIGKRGSKLKTGIGFGPDKVFHSIRKTVVTIFENAGVAENVVADIVGHKKQTMTFGLYSGGTSLAVKAEAMALLDYRAD